MQEYNVMQDKRERKEVSRKRKTSRLKKEKQVAFIIDVCKLVYKNVPDYLSIIGTELSYIPCPGSLFFGLVRGSRLAYIN